jgi:hypothetical protein
MHTCKAIRTKLQSFEPISETMSQSGNAIIEIVKNYVKDKKANNIDNLLIRVGHLLLEEQLQFISS